MSCGASKSQPCMVFQDLHKCAGSQPCHRHRTIWKTLPAPGCGEALVGTGNPHPQQPKTYGNSALQKGGTACCHAQFRHLEPKGLALPVLWPILLQEASSSCLRHLEPEVPEATRRLRPRKTDHLLLKGKGMKTVLC